MAITASMVAELRAKTDAPMMECKKALAEAGGDMAKAAAGEEFLAVEADDPGRFLPAMLERVEPQRGRRRRVIGADRTEDSAFLAQLVAIAIKEGVSHIEGCHRHHQTCPRTMLPRRKAPMAM